MAVKHKLVSLTKVVSQSSMDFNVLKFSFSEVDNETYRYAVGYKLWDNLLSVKCKNHILSNDIHLSTNEKEHA